MVHGPSGVSRHVCENVSDMNSAPVAVSWIQCVLSSRIDGVERVQWAVRAEVERRTASSR